MRNDRMGLWGFRSRNQTAISRDCSRREQEARACGGGRSGRVRDRELPDPTMTLAV
jgi:hypothetical protein